MKAGSKTKGDEIGSLVFLNSEKLSILELVMLLEE
jgi:hypothetical protein